jgi:hypothetical protein
VPSEALERISVGKERLPKHLRPPWSSGRIIRSFIFSSCIGWGGMLHCALRYRIKKR